MISKRLVNLIFNHILDPWLCPLDARVSDMEAALDDAIGNTGYIDGIYFLKAGHTLYDNGKKVFPMYRVTITLEVRGKSTAVCIGEVISISVEDRFAKLMIENKGKIHYVMLPTDSEDLKVSETIVKKRYGAVKW